MDIRIDYRSIKYWGLVYTKGRTVAVYGKRRRLPSWWTVGRDAK